LRGARAEVKGAYLRVEIAARQYNPYSLTCGLQRTLAGWRERPWAFPSCLTASDKSLGGMQGALSKGGPAGELPRRPAGQSPIFHGIGLYICGF